MDWDTYEKKLLQNPKVREALKETEAEYQIARSLIESRLKKIKKHPFSHTFGSTTS